jgi:DNA-binding transcriptional LysR family regulator
MENACFSPLRYRLSYLGILPFIEEELSTSRLFQPFQLTVKLEPAYYLINHRKSIKRPAVKKVREWLLAQIESKIY